MKVAKLQIKRDTNAESIEGYFNRVLAAIQGENPDVYIINVRTEIDKDRMAWCFITFNDRPRTHHS